MTESPRLDRDRNTFRVDGVVDYDGTKIWGSHELTKMHSEDRCQRREGPCVVHRPSQHHMSDWGLVWNGQDTQMERLCPHDLPHPDPDDVAYWKWVGQSWKSNHDCDGCCIKGPRPLFRDSGGDVETFTGGFKLA